MTPYIFGVRHLSPASAFHLCQMLDEVKPTAVLIEGPSDASDLMNDIVRTNTTPPIAIMAYTQQLPVKTILYPLAEYSPEYQAIKWAKKHHVHVEFIDLPSTLSIPSQDLDNHGLTWDFYEQIVESANELDYESFWERQFEQIQEPHLFVRALTTFSEQLRSFDAESERNRIREAFMREKITMMQQAGHKVFVVTGAFHIKGLREDTEVFNEKLIQPVPTKLTLMPYANYKLSSLSGYGAGNHAPNYFSMMWKCLQNDTDLPTFFLSSIAIQMRQLGNFRSSAEVIESVRLAHSLATFRNSKPTLRDLRDAATVCLGRGDFSSIVQACAKVEVGNSIGSLPEGVSQTSLQDDFYRELKRLKLEKYRTNEIQLLELDLRENRRVKSVEAAFLDLNRSFFLHKLEVLGIKFAIPSSTSQDRASWAENWNVQWTPEVEIQIVESTLLGETLNLATAYQLKNNLDQCETISKAASITYNAYICGMTEMMETAKVTLQRLSVDAGDFNDTALAINEIARLIQYGDVRKIDTASFIPIIERLFLRVTLLLLPASGCDNVAAREMMTHVQRVNAVGIELYEHVDEALWTHTLRELALRDDRNPLLSGYACTLLLERNNIDQQTLAEEISRRLSPGVPVDLGTGWFEGLCMKNKYALLSRFYIWEKIDQYVTSLSDEQFQRAVVFLRRAFTSFTNEDRTRVAESLGDLWNMDTDLISEQLAGTLNEAEEALLEQLNEFDFDF